MQQNMSYRTFDLEFFPQAWRLCLRFARTNLGNIAVNTAKRTPNSVNS